MKKNHLKKALALLLTVASVVSMSGCGNAERELQSSGNEQTDSASGVENSSSDVSAKDPVTITVFPENAMQASGIVGGFRGDVFAESGIVVDVWAYSDEKKNSILASGTLPDIMVVSSDELELLIESNKVLNLEDYMDKLPHIANNENMTEAINYMKNFCSAGTGGLYGMPKNAGEKAMTYSTTKNMLVINWEYYKGIGAPEFKDQWELIEVMKQMQEAYPTAKDGTQMWGTYLNAGSDTDSWGNMLQYFKWFGYETTELYYLLEADMVNGTYASILDENSKYYEGLKWYNTAYREGVLDPDSINRDRSTQKAKVDGGYAMVPSGSIQGYGGYQPMYMEGAKVYQATPNSIYGDSNYIYVINAKSENIETALAYLDLMSDPDRIMELLCGPEGDLWYLDDAGTIHIKEGIYDSYIENGKMYLESGEELQMLSLTTTVFDRSAYTSYIEADGDNVVVRYDCWDEWMERAYDTEQMNEWREISGYDFYVNQAMANDAYVVDSKLDYVSNFTSIPDDVMKLTLDSIKDVVVAASWKMVYAQTDAEFEDIWNKMVADCNGLGAEDVIAWRLEDLENARAIRDSLSE